MRKTRRTTTAGDGDTGDVLVSIRPAVLDDAEHAVGNLLQRIHHTARVSLAGAEPEDKERVRVALGDLERLLELLFDYVSPVVVQVRPTEADRVASSMVSQVREHAGESVPVVGVARGKVLVDPRTLSRCFQLMGSSLGAIWKESGDVAVDVAEGTNGEGVVFGVRISGGQAPLGAAARVGLAVAGRLIELQGGELHWDGGDSCGACRVTLPRDGERYDGV